MNKTKDIEIWEDVDMAEDIPEEIIVAEID